MWDTLMTRNHEGDDPAIAAAIRAFAALRAQNDRVVSRIAEAHGIGPSDLRAISFVESNDAATPTRVGEFLGFTTGSVTTLLDRIERAGYVTRVAHPGDRRSVHLEVTPEGSALMAGVRGLYAVAFGETIADGEAQRFTDDLLGITRRLAHLLDEVGPELAALR